METKFKVRTLLSYAVACFIACFCVGIGIGIHYWKGEATVKSNEVFVKATAIISGRDSVILKLDHANRVKDRENVEQAKRLEDVEAENKYLNSLLSAKIHKAVETSTRRPVTKQDIKTVDAWIKNRNSKLVR